MDEIADKTGLFQRAKKFVLRWQDQTVFLPLMVLMALAAWVVLSVFDRTAGKDMLSMLVQLPILCAYAGAALALAWFARRRQRRMLSDAQQEELWQLLLVGNRGATLIYIMDFFVWLTSFVLLLAFFWPQR